MTNRSAVKRHRSKAAKKPPPNFDQALAHKCERLIGARVASMQYPGGKSRQTVKLLLRKGNKVYISQRSSKYRADIERLILTTMAKSDAPAPKLLGSDGKKTLIQEDIPGQRLTQAIHKQDSATIHRHLDNALSSLTAIHQAGSEHGLDEQLNVLGDSEEWVYSLIDRPRILGDFFDIPAPELDIAVLADKIKIRSPRFVKWDARPGNAIATEAEKIYWIDWEHSGCRNRLDDMVWLLADEYLPDRPEIEAELIEKYLPEFADDLSPEKAREYFYTLGVFHLCVRLGLIFKNKEDGSWWNYERCLAGDKVGVTRRNARRLCMRGKRWAEKTKQTQPLAQWYDEVKSNL